MSGCSSCGGNCGSCGGCAGSLELTQWELNILKELSQIPFLPIGRKADSDTPIYPEGENVGLALLCLEKKDLVSLDYDQPIRGFAYPEHIPAPLRGSMALTQRGQQVLELLDFQGID